jgi:hypothetical protein
MILLPMRASDTALRQLGNYWPIMIQVEKSLPFMPMVCMMGVTTSPLNPCYRRERPGSLDSYRFPGAASRYGV